MQLGCRSARTRAVATALAGVLLAAGVLAMQHASDVAHVRDPHSGGMVHAQELAENHDSSAVDHLHGTAEHDGHIDTGACALLAVVHVTPATGAPLSIAHTAGTFALPFVPVISARIELAGYRIAPKTSPPLA